MKQKTECLRNIKTKQVKMHQTHTSGCAKNLAKRRIFKLEGAQIALHTV